MLPAAVPFALHAFRASLVLALALVPRNHPRREVLAIEVVLLALASDLLDGQVARLLRMTHLAEIAWGDYGADYAFALGALAVLGLRLSLARDLPPRPVPTPPSSRTWARRALGLHVVLLVLLSGEVYYLIVARTLRVSS